MVDYDLRKRILALRERVVADFDAGDWEEVGLLTGYSDLISRHPRLLRSLSWGDEDYAGNALTIIKRIAEQDENAFAIFEKHVAEKYPEESQFISAKPSERKITFAPNVFQVPENTAIESDLIAVTMPFNAAFNTAHEGIRRACSAAGYRCLRVDDIWEESTVIQDIFNLIFRGQVANHKSNTGNLHNKKPRPKKSCLIHRIIGYVVESTVSLPIFLPIAPASAMRAPGLGFSQRCRFFAGIGVVSDFKINA